MNSVMHTRVYIAQLFTVNMLRLLRFNYTEIEIVANFGSQTLSECHSTVPYEID